MSINFTSDIDGATSGSGITKIMVGGKTINLAEVSSGESAGGVASGSFTPEDKATSHVIDTGIDFTHIFFWKKTTTLNYGYRTFCGLFCDIENNIIYLTNTNSGGTSYAGSATDFESSLVGCTKDGTKLNFAPQNSTYGYLCPEEYVWYAW